MFQKFVQKRQECLKILPSRIWPYIEKNCWHCCHLKWSATAEGKIIQLFLFCDGWSTDCKDTAQLLLFIVIKLRLFKCQLSKGKMVHFPAGAQHISQQAHAELNGKYAKQIETLRANYERRLTLCEDEEVRSVARISQQGGTKTTRGGTFFKYYLGCMQQPGGQTWNGGTYFK